MSSLSEILIKHADHAHFWVFGCAILAGCNIPVSIDLLILLSAFLAAVVIPEHLWHLLLSVWIGCYLSAWCSYGMGRFLGRHLERFKWFRKILPKEKIEKIRNFYGRYGLWTLVFGRFIPFGVRNCIFMTTGMSRVRFFKFITMDALACSLWVLTTFSIFYHLSHHYELIWKYLKAFNAIIFVAFGVTVISLLWYKRRKRSRCGNLSQ